MVHTSQHPGAESRVKEVEGESGWVSGNHSAQEAAPNVLSNKVELPNRPKDGTGHLMEENGVIDNLVGSNISWEIGLHDKVLIKDFMRLNDSVKAIATSCPPTLSLDGTTVIGTTTTTITANM